MMAFWAAKLVFLSVPKTGTHAYMAALGDRADVVLRHPQNLKHTNAQRMRNKILPTLFQDHAGTFETLAVIREPVDWLGSWYRYRSRDALNGKPNSTAGRSFNDFVAAHLSDAPPAWASVGSQARFISNGQSEVIVDHLFAYDRQDDLRAFLSARLGFAIPTPPARNVSPELVLDLSPELAARLREERAADFAVYARAMGV